jgi:hypothetical protein
MMVSGSRALLPSREVFDVGKDWENANRGPIWRDVSELIAECEQRWGGVWVCSVRPHVGRGRSGYMWVVCERTHAVTRSGATAQERTGRPYPTSDGISMPSLMYELLCELVSRLEADSALAKRQASF